MLYLIISFLLILIFVGGLNLWFSRKKFREITARFNRLERLIWESSALNGLLAGQRLLPRPGGWTASTDILYELAHLVQKKEPKLIVELGSGLSTIVLATAAARYGGKIVSIDHDVNFARQTKQEVDQRGLSESVDIRVAPLKMQNLNGEMCEWYDVDVFSDLTDIGLVFVDGPPPVGQEDIRKPALPYFWNRLEPTGGLVLDDAARTWEQQIITEWKELLPSAIFTEIEAEKGALYVRKQKAD